MRSLRIRLNRSLQDKVVIRVVEGFQWLPEESIQEILQYLHWPTDFYNLSLVSRVLNRLANNELYSILVVGYHRPERTSALLEHLQLRPELASLVTTLVFDEDVKSIGPKLLDPVKWPPRAHRRELADGWDPKSPNRLSLTSYPHNHHHESISTQLSTVLPGLKNIRRVIVRSIHPLYIHPKPAEVKLTHESHHVTLEPRFRCNFYSCVSSMAELFVNGVTNQMPPKAMLSQLTTICISDLYFDKDPHALQAYAWNVVLAHAVNLQTLGMIYVEYAHMILQGIVCPSLQALELYKFFGEPDEHEPQVLPTFIRCHSSTLRTLALSTHVESSVNYCDWLSDKDILPKLQTLRLDHIYALVGNGLAAEDIDPAKLIISFIAHRPTILDVGISYLPTSKADDFAEHLAQTRPMRNIFIGSTVIQSLKRHASLADRRYWDYSYEAWMFYHVFKDLTISRSGFRPRLPSQSWKFWKKV
ncbi:hypothetical protein JB92DRAFT_3091852 [Gautieria morchelliformis]|nr:hypothetical protein JB92DRAFT_3091852 [Gautieria morchelliformis]